MNSTATTTTTTTSTGWVSHILAERSVILFAIPLCILLVYYTKTKKGKSIPRTSRPVGKTTPSKMDQRPFGYWEPNTSFKTPNPPPFPNWSLTGTKPIPYRAFKHKYTITMGIRNMDWHSWIELDNQWKYYHDLKLKRLATKGDDLYNTSPKAVAASWEFLEELLDYLPVRYPSLFHYDKEKRVIKILATEEVYDLNDKECNPIVTAAKLIQDDIAIMVENEDDGQYSLESGCITLAGFWKIKDKFQMKLDQIHTSGDVPKYKTHLGPAMNKFFRRLTVESPVVRNNYFIQTDNHLDWSSSIGSEEDANVGWNTAPDATDVNNLFFRSERQSLRRLPRTGAVAFTVRTYFIPMVELCKEPYVPRRLLNGITSWDEDVNEYRGFYKFKDVLLPYLEERAKEQEASGLDQLAEPQVYPY
ncbi:hypothetical protein KGF57_003735 [Candida theae]|uniref:HRQ family protein 1 n=1 Tax=Candida theae TaxID=1198502 RepID=A0AAD5BC54_9ASCO|nr:uncharacterized protein KGF57_003735 [Candida theae]KAI5954712.1 hypothetical protein KGF57_003735 [Candida theae]